MAELDRGFVHPVSPPQVIVSYFQAGRICDYINEKWGWDTLLAMLHDFGAGEETSAVVRKELKIEPEEFDKRFLAYVEADTKNAVDHFDEWKNESEDRCSKLSKTKDWTPSSNRVRPSATCIPDYVEERSVYEALAEAYLAKGDKPAAIEELVRYEKIGGRDPESSEAAGQDRWKKRAARRRPPTR